MKISNALNFKLISFVILTIMLFGTTNQVVGHGDLIMIEGAMKAQDHCDNPTKSFTVTPAPDGSFAYDKSEYKVDKNTCYKMTFRNLRDMEHDVSIEEVSGSAGIGYVHLHVINSTAGPNHDGSISQNILTPNADTEFKMYCTIDGHDASGMHAQLVVGKGSSKNALPGFEFLSAFAGVIALTVFLKKKRIILSEL